MQRAFCRRAAPKYAYGKGSAQGKKNPLAFRLRRCIIDIRRRRGLLLSGQKGGDPPGAESIRPVQILPRFHFLPHFAALSRFYSCFVRCCPENRYSRRFLCSLSSAPGRRAAAEDSDGEDGIPFPSEKADRRISFIGKNTAGKMTAPADRSRILRLSMSAGATCVLQSCVFFLNMVK